MITEVGESTESRLVLLSLRDALMRMNYACDIKLHTESYSTAAAIEKEWPKAWAEADWKNKKGKEIANVDLWKQIIEMTEEDGHCMAAVVGKHEFSAWMQWKMETTPALRDAFQEIKEE